MAVLMIYFFYSAESQSLSDVSMRFASSLILKYDNNYLKMNAFDK